MILRSLSKHVKDQNWFAVFLDFFIVVVGVFMGIQVANWNVELDEKHEEQVLLKRLLEDTNELLKLQDNSISSYQQRIDRLESAYAVIYSNEPIRPITQRECRAIIGSHVYRKPPDEIPVLDEVISSGRFDILKNDTIKLHLRNYLLARESARGRYAETNNELLRLHIRYPDLIKLKRIPYQGQVEPTWIKQAGEGFIWDSDCDIDAMLEAQGFRNELFDNTMRLYLLTDDFHERKDLLEKLQTALSYELDGKNIKEGMN